MYFSSIMTCSYTKAILFAYIISLIYAKPTSDPCEVPSDLMIQYKRLTNASSETLFFSHTPKFTMESKEINLIVPNNESKVLSKVSTCPWTIVYVNDSTVYPSNRAEAVCSCKTCNGSSSIFQCVQVFTKAPVLKRTNQCIDGLYVFKPTEIDVPTACVCASVISLVAGYEKNDNNYNSDEYVY
ncbi:interleukin 17-like protein [Octopus bimaculoides]|uniref:Interleukin 17-like protein n=1 Tax=Octopus bimaculoides TaxID=37653 RepID=A0A0L8G018_OCTBM|nr:interleukin 17-like protein [Octopus bimaculoides]|eukprot:XP_014785380.1 PREDICTED: interleukin 17-like protein [Octopus bimaculoides]